MFIGVYFQDFENESISLTCSIVKFYLEFMSIEESAGKAGDEEGFRRIGPVRSPASQPFISIFYAFFST
jgi:hypothetical protein